MSVKDNTSLKDASIQSVVPSESTQANQSVRVLSSEDSLIADLVKEQPTLEKMATLKVKPMGMPDLLAFPEEVLERQDKEYHFVWLNKNKDLSVKLRTDGWVLANRVTCPWIKPHRFGSHGALEQGGMLLAFMRKEHSDIFYSRPGQQSTAKIKYVTDDIFKMQDKDAPIGLYKPEDKGENE